MKLRCLNPVICLVAVCMGVFCSTLVWPCSLSASSAFFSELDREFGTPVKELSFNFLAQDYNVIDFADSASSWSKSRQDIVLLAGADLPSKPTPYGSFKLPNGPYRPDGSKAVPSDNNPIFTGNTSPSQETPQNVWRMDGMPYDASSIILEGVKGNSSVVRNQVERNLDHMLQEQIRQTIDKGGFQ